VLERPHEAVGRGDEHQHEQRVGIVEAEHQRGHGSEREDRPGGETGGGAEPALDGRVQQGHRRDALQGLGHQHAPAAEAEDPP